MVRVTAALPITVADLSFCFSSGVASDKGGNGRIHERKIRNCFECRVYGHLFFFLFKASVLSIPRALEPSDRDLLRPLLYFYECMIYCGVTVSLMPHCATGGASVHLDFVSIK